MIEKQFKSFVRFEKLRIPYPHRRNRGLHSIIERSQSTTRVLVQALQSLGCGIQPDLVIDFAFGQHGWRITSADVVAQRNNGRLNAAGHERLGGRERKRAAETRPRSVDGADEA